MSSRAMEALFDLDLKTKKVDGTMFAVLQYLCYRHDDSLNRAWPGLDRIAAELSMAKGRVWEAINRLKKAELVAVTRGRARASNQYTFPWLPQQSGRPDCESTFQRSGGAERERWAQRSGGAVSSGRVEQFPAVGPTRTKNSKTVKQGNSQNTELPPDTLLTPADRVFAAAMEAADRRRKKDDDQQAAG